MIMKTPKGHNLKWFWAEILKMYSAQTSFFSKKRVESGLAFIIAQAGMIIYFIDHFKSLTMTDFVMWAAVEFAIAGYLVAKTERSKITQLSSSLNNDATEEDDTTQTTTKINE